MHKKTAVAHILIDDETAVILKVIELFSPEHVPVGCPILQDLPDRRALNAWWCSRSIPASRSGIREVLEMLDMTSTQQLLSKCYGLSLSDHYWINPDEHPLDWDMINFFDNPFSDDVGNVLFGNQVGDELDLISPDNTSDGWLKKKWKIIDTKRCLIKGGSYPFQQEPLNEVIASALHQRLSLAVYVPYQTVWEDNLPYSVCENFTTKDTEFINAHSIFTSMKKPNHVSSYVHFLDCCDRLGIPNMDSFLDYMLTTDFIMANTDRHFGNFGALRNANTLKWIGPAPIFDSGTSLYHDRLSQQISTSLDAASKPFKTKHTHQLKLVKDMSWLDFNSLVGFDEEVRGILSASSFIEGERMEALSNALLERINQLKQAIELEHSR